MKMAMTVSLVLAVASSAVTWWPSAPAAVGPLDRKGELLTPGGETVDAGRVASLRVVTWDPDDGGAQVFEVAQKGGDWVIPSHFDYPAEGGTRVGNTAGSVLNVPRGALVTDDTKRHAELGVVDPLKEGGTDAEGRGKRITLKDAGGQVLVDLIVGKKAEHANVNYVREASDAAVYTATVQSDFSTTFKDWVEVDPLKIKRWHIRHLRIEDYSVDEESGTLQTRDTTELRKPKDAEAWTAAAPPEGKQVDTDKVGKLLTEITNLKLVGVRPYSDAWLNARGFYVASDRKLKGNEGALFIRTQDGISYQLYFGEIALGDDADQSADAHSADAEGAENASGDDPPADESEGHNRYMAVFVQYNPALDEGRKEPGAGEEPEKVQDTEGYKAAVKAQARFQKFFYVIDDKAFQGLRPTRDFFFKDAEKKEEEEQPDEGGETKDEGTGEAGDAKDAGEPEKGDAAPPPPKEDDDTPPATDPPSTDEPKKDDPAPPTEPGTDEPK